MAEPIKPNRGAVYCPIPLSNFKGPARYVQMRTMRFMRARLEAGRSSRKSGLLTHKCPCCRNSYPADTRFFNPKPDEAIGLVCRCRVCAAGGEGRERNYTVITRSVLSAMRDAAFGRVGSFTAPKAPKSSQVILVTDNCPILCRTTGKCRRNCKPAAQAA